VNQKQIGTLIRSTKRHRKLIPETECMRHTERNYQIFVTRMMLVVELR